MLLYRAIQILHTGYTGSIQKGYCNYLVAMDTDDSRRLHKDPAGYIWLNEAREDSDRFHEAVQGYGRLHHKMMLQLYRCKMFL